MQYEYYTNKNTHIIYDPALIPDSPEALFCDETSSRLTRGAAHFFEYQGMALVHKRYHRGGFLGRFIRNSYQFSQLGMTRMWREFELLGQLHTMGLPVPQPVAARCQRRFGLRYHGDLVTRCIPETQTLTQRLSHTALTPETWQSIGAMIARFHKHQVYHSDLNAHNILIDNDNRLYLIDFDKGAIRDGDHWKTANLQRLHRSLSKLRHQNPALNFHEADWQSLLTGYTP